MIKVFVLYLRAILILAWSVQRVSVQEMVSYLYNDIVHSPFWSSFCVMWALFLPPWTNVWLHQEYIEKGPSVSPYEECKDYMLSCDLETKES